MRKEEAAARRNQTIRALLPGVAAVGVYAYGRIEIDMHVFEPSEIEDLVAVLPEKTAMRVRARFGLGEYASETRDRRNRAYASSFPKRDAPDEMGTSLEDLSRADQAAALVILAARMNSVLVTPEQQVELGPLERWDTLEYWSRMTLPDAEAGPMVTEHRRTISSRVGVLNEFRITQKSTWLSGKMPEYTSEDLDVHTENVRNYVDPKGVPGYSYELVLKLPSIAKGVPFSFGWKRIYEMVPGDSQVSDEWDGVDVRPQMELIPSATIGVQFGAHHLPRRIETFANIEHDDRYSGGTGEPAVARQGLVERTFKDAKRGQSSGIRWQW